MKSSSDVVGAVIKELRLQSGQPGGCFRMAVAVDGLNALWGRSTIKKEDKSPVRLLERERERGRGRHRGWAE